MGQFAGLAPALVQAVVMLVGYRLCQLSMIGGTANLVPAASLLGLPLGTPLPVFLTTAAAGTPLLVGIGLLAAVLVVAHVSSRQQVARLREDAGGGEPAPVPMVLARVLPYGALVTAAVMPVALSVLLLVSSTWVLAERAVLSRWV